MRCMTFHRHVLMSPSPLFLGGRKRPKTIHCHQLLEILLMIQSEFTLVESTHFILAVEKSLLLEHNGYLFECINSLWSFLLEEQLSCNF
uniref:Uncharacterized protein n=1 Tax=Populus trichocarpa TaxID=3694 RepID=A0A3N7F766_POPTR